MFSIDRHNVSLQGNGEIEGLEKDTASSSGSTNDGILNIIEGLTRENEKKKKRGKVLKSLKDEILHLKEENVELKEKILGLKAIMDQDGRVNQRRIECLTNKVSYAEAGIGMVAKEMKVFNNARSAIPMIKKCGKS